MDQEFNVDFKKLISFGWAHEKSTETHPFLKWSNQNFLPLFLMLGKGYANSEHKIICFRLSKGQP